VIQNLISDNLNHLKRLRGSNRVNQHIPMNANEVLRVQNRIFILRPISPNPHQDIKYHVISPRGGKRRISAHLPSGINDLSGVVLTLKLDNFAEGVLDRGGVALYKVPVYELHREGGFSLRNVSERDSI